jgi:hypothetical protein
MVVVFPAERNERVRPAGSSGRIDRRGGQDRIAESGSGEDGSVQNWRAGGCSLSLSSEGSAASIWHARRVAAVRVLLA